MENNRPKIGVGVIIKKGNTVLLGQRQGSHGAGEWSFPGGHLEFGESIEDCVKREVAEETGLFIEHVTKCGFTNDIFESEQKHYVTLFVVTEWKGGEPELREPQKCKEWKWCEWNDLPEPLFLPIRHLMQEGFTI